jgi:hypothetical protein
MMRLPIDLAGVLHTNLSLSLIGALMAGSFGSSVATPAWEPHPSPVFVGAGDIASCYDDNDEATARLLDEIEGTVFTLGDNAYDHGSAVQFAACYAPTWGRHLARTRPTPGNHDYSTHVASAYFAYFGERAGDPAQGYYSFELGEWHIVALNTNCAEVGGCGEGSDQLAWLRADLAAHPGQCTLAYGHHPRYSSGGHDDDADLTQIWELLHDGGVDVVLSGHDHTYERFAPQDSTGAVDAVGGIRQFVVGTGGARLYGFEAIRPNSEVRNSETFGVLALTLQPTSYVWEFVPIAGADFSDRGSTVCHSRGPR